MQYENVRKNKIQTGITIFLFMVGIYFLSYFVCKSLNFGNLSIIIAFFLSIGSTFFTYWNSDKIVLKVANAREPNSIEEHYINELLVNLCIAAGLSKRPKLYIMESEQQNAFATGRNLENSVICLTTGIIKKLDKPELEAVIGHELTHIMNNDISITTVVSVMAGFLTILSDMALRYGGYYRGSSDNEDSSGSLIVLIIGIIALLLAPLISTIVQMFISRRREYMADAGSVALTRNPDAMINALIKIHEDANVMDVPVNSVKGLFISDPDPKLKNFKGKSSIFSSHPSLEERINAIQNLR